MTHAFLADIARRVAADHPINDWHQVTVVLPSRRAALFLRKHLLTIAGRPFIAPRIITINEFIETIAQQTTAESLTLLFELYESYRGIEGGNSEPFEIFSRWGQIMMSDFNEIDRYLINTKIFFTDLRNIQEIEDWSFNRSDLSDSQNKYLSFWNKLGDYYNAFIRRCHEQQLFSSGTIYRIASEKVADKLSAFEKGSIYIAGFNAISASEEKIIHALCQAEKAFFLVDADAVYVHNKNHEAGIFVRHLFKNSWFASNPVHHHFEEIPKKIQITGVPGNTLQASVAGKILSEIEEEDLNETVVVLADEQLLLPVIHSLPESVTAVNITMGYALRNTTLFTFLSNWFELQNGIKYSSQGEPKFYTPSVLHMLVNSESETLSAHGITAITEKIMTSGKLFLKPEDLKAFAGEDNKDLLQLFVPWTQFPEDVFHYITETLEKLHRSYAGSKPLQQEFVFIALTTIRRLKHLLMKYPFVSDLKTLTRIILQLVKSENVPFFGEPLKGLQILGMLESRALDFKNVIILSVNEDILPKGNFAQSLIPFDLKKHYHLPTFTETDAVFAHHFYRLIQRAENVFLLYNSEGDQLGGGEKSRFILQLEEELATKYQHLKIETVPASFSENSVGNTESIEVKNTPAIISKIEKLLENGISPSAISAFVECPLDFYYKYVIGLREEEFEENIDDAKFGSIIHKILYDLYLPLQNKVLIKEDLTSLKLQLPAKAKEVFQEIMQHADTTSGKNYLSFNVILQYCERAIDNDIRLVEDHELIITELEKTMNETIEVYPFGEIKTIRLKGIADRIDSLDGTLRIIDYKTGNADDQSVSAKAEKVKEKAKALQLLIYAHLSLQITGRSSVKALLYSLRQAGTIELPLKIDSVVEFQPESTGILSEILTEIIEKLMDDKTIFRHQPDSLYCRYCG